MNESGKRRNVRHWWEQAVQPWLNSDNQLHQVFRALQFATGSR